ncbi:hypothetical protein [Paenibacillus sp. EPM92]|uniref:hypothetical protein n=1 Tax=Paenibacillus sp. EPM92 TaxID=1561195 RepID=UPI001F43252D|nr:hypothetical protein [Paenibacillus sp. EPM92]
MEKVNSPEELMENISNMSRDNSVYHFHIPGKGKFTLVLQEEEQRSIQAWQSLEHIGVTEILISRGLSIMNRVVLWSPAVSSPSFAASDFLPRKRMISYNYSFLKQKLYSPIPL